MMDDPLQLLRQSVEKAQKIKGLQHPNTFVLATVDAVGQPHQRSLLLKQWTAQGFVFFTNCRSPKAQHLEQQPRASAHFYWEGVGQVRALGEVEKCLPEVGQKYWATRSRASQLAQLVSQQSQPIESRQHLEALYTEAQEKFKNRPVPCPAHWGGYEFRVEGLEFWRDDPRRFHDRILYTRKAGAWSVKKLQP